MASSKRTLLCETALDYLGFNEADGSHRLIVDIYNAIRPLPRGYKLSYSDPWCAAFVSAMGADAGLSHIVLPECSCEAMIALYKARGLWQERDEHLPRMGDIVMYDWEDTGEGDNTGVADHVGIVVQVQGNVLTVIEGNVGDEVARRQLTQNSRHIRGYCLPDYGDETKHDDPSGAAVGDGVLDVPPENGITLGLPQLSRPASGETVRAAQLLLIGRGSRCGPYGADGIFGDATYGAVWGFQKGHRLETDGVIGPKTWAALLGL